ncbi:hypothetical protein KY321_01970, partial [Candidatus Woesearchaeota archaeon]|nr:hypothetical protein [Candidatus Woesearchaeota archaeon]
CRGADCWEVNYTRNQEHYCDGIDELINNSLEIEESNVSDINLSELDIENSTEAYIADLTQNTLKGYQGNVSKLIIVKDTYVWKNETTEIVDDVEQFSITGNAVTGTVEDNINCSQILKVNITDCKRGDQIYIKAKRWPGYFEKQSPEGPWWNKVKFFTILFALIIIVVVLVTESRTGFKKVYYRAKYPDFLGEEAKIKRDIALRKLRISKLDSDLKHLDSEYKRMNKK